MARRTKVLVLGGGPAGSVAAAALAREGLDVRLVESARFPRYHVGESLTPSCRAVLEAIGVAAKLDDHGFVIKHGGVIHWDSDDWVFDWGAQVGSRSWQVDRGEFDDLLLQHARDCGVAVTTGVTARNVTFAGDRPISVECRSEKGETLIVDDFGFLVDATGRSGLLSTRHLANRRPLKTLRNVGIWGYWYGATTLPDTPAGGINVISSPAGWYWLIPLAGGRMSIGYVTRKDTFARNQGGHASPEAFYRHLIDESPTVADLVAGAEYVGPVRVETDYSYTADRFCGPGYVIVGDAACFLDPLLSTGVHLALFSAFTAAACIASVDRHEVTEEEALRFFEFAYRRSYTRLFAMVSVMYERYLGKDGFFRTSDRLIGDAARPSEPASSFSFAEIIAGLSDLREASDASTRVLTDRLTHEALNAQQRSVNTETGPGMPDFTSVLENPLNDAESADYRLITAPHLGLQRTRRHEMPQNRQR